MPTSLLTLRTLISSNLFKTENICWFIFNELPILIFFGILDKLISVTIPPLLGIFFTIIELKLSNFIWCVPDKFLTKVEIPLIWIVSPFSKLWYGNIFNFIVLLFHSIIEFSYISKVVFKLVISSPRISDILAEIPPPLVSALSNIKDSPTEYSLPELMIFNFSTFPGRTVSIIEVCFNLLLYFGKKSLLEYWLFTLYGNVFLIKDVLFKSKLWSIIELS